MKLGQHAFEQDTQEMSDSVLVVDYNILISDQVVANAVMAVLLKLEIERRRDERLQAEARSAAGTSDMMNGEGE